VHYPNSGTHFHCYVALDQSRDGEARQIMLALLGWDPYLKSVIAVDSDIDITDDSQVLWALATHFQPHLDMFMIDGLPGSPLDPSSSVNGTTSRMGLDATRGSGFDGSRRSSIRTCSNGRGNCSKGWHRERQRMVVGISGASGFIYGVRLLQLLAELNIESHLIISRAALRPWPTRPTTNWPMSLHSPATTTAPMTSPPGSPAVRFAAWAWWSRRVRCAPWRRLPPARRPG
jgi:3-polyprenyl-4-hydroxybenzoate decarboxylase